MNKWILSTAVICAALTANEVRADGFGQTCTGPYCNHRASPANAKFGRTLPVFMAAPWYLYWPYDAHFMTPAPMQGAYYAPPVMGNYPVQPYFPTPQYTAPMMGGNPGYQPQANYQQSGPAAYQQPTGQQPTVAYPPTVRPVSRAQSPGTQAIP